MKVTVLYCRFRELQSTPGRTGHRLSLKPSPTPPTHLTHPLPLSPPSLGLVPVLTGPLLNRKWRNAQVPKIGSKRTRYTSTNPFMLTRNELTGRSVTVSHRPSSIVLLHTPVTSGSPPPTPSPPLQEVRGPEVERPRDPTRDRSTGRVPPGDPLPGR